MTKRPARPVPQQVNGRKPAAKPAAGTTPDKWVQWRWRHPRGLGGVVEIADGGEVDHYVVRRITPVRYRLTKMEADRECSYDVVIPSAANDAGRCGCEGFVRRKECRHVKAMLALDATGKV